MNIIEKALEKANLVDAGSNKSDDNHSDVDDSVEETDDEEISLFNEVDKALQSEERRGRTSSKPIERFNWDYLHEHGYIDPTTSHMKIAEEFRSIKRPLVINAFGEHDQGIDRANLILVTSSIPGEGKSFTAINLAISIAAERDKQVLLIDADVAKPSISRILGIKKGPGLIEYLEGSGVK